MASHFLVVASDCSAAAVNGRGDRCVGRGRRSSFWTPGGTRAR